MQMMIKISRYTLTLFLLFSLKAQSFYIGLELDDGLTQNQRSAFIDARNRWQKIIITEDLPKVVGNEDFDIVIKASSSYIDGPNNILGQAAPTHLRPGSFIPSRAIMTFDSADLSAMEKNSSLNNVILHEMAHALGFGTIWDQLKLIGGSSNDPIFVGNNAATVYQQLTKSLNLIGVPLENQFGPGTRRSHWRESIFKNELMTGILDEGYNPLSALTIAAFKDMGYEVDFNQADKYALPQPLFVASRGTMLSPAYLTYGSYSHGNKHPMKCCPVKSNAMYYSELVPPSTCTLL